MGTRRQADPRYLLIGAGVTGSYYAARLQRAGVRVTILCRKKRQEFIRENGVVLTEHYSRTRSHLAVRTVSEPEDVFDYVLIFLPAHRTGDVLPILEQLSAARAFIFFGNNVTGFSEARRRLGDDRVLAGFPSVYGVRERQVVRYADSPRSGKGSFNILRIGEVGEPNNRAVRDLRRSCARAGIKVRRSTRMQDFLLTRASLIIPLVLGLYGHGHKTAELAADRKRMRLVIRARRELIAVLRAAGVRITPYRCRLKLLLPESLLVARLKRFLERSFAEIAFAAHTGEARRESASLYRGLQQTAERLQMEMPAFEELYQSASRSGSRRR